MAESRKPPKPAAPKGRLPKSGPPIARPPKPTRKPTSKPTAKPPAKAPVVKAVANSAPVPVGKVVSVSSSNAAPSFGVDESLSSTRAYANRRRSTPLGVWLGMGGGLIVVGVLVGFLVMKFGSGEEPQTKDEDKNGLAIAAGSSDDASEEAAAKDATADEGDADKRPADSEKVDSEKADSEKADDASAAKPNDKKPSGKKPSGKRSDGNKKPSATKPVKPAASRLSKYPTIREVPQSDTPPALETAILEAIALAENGKFDKLLSDFIDPEEASFSRRRGQPRSPQDITGHSEALTLAALKALGSRKPHLFDEGTVAVYSLSRRTLPTFVNRDGKWYLSTGRVVDISRRFRLLAGVDRLIYQLERLNPGKKAISAKGVQRSEAQDEFIARLLAMGAEVAVNGPDDEIFRTAVLLDHRYKGGDAGLGILQNLANLEVLIFDATGSFTDKGLMKIDPIHSLRHVEYLRIRNALPITIHFMKMEKLETLRLDAVVGDRDLGHLTRLFELKHLSISSKEITDEGLEQLDVLPLLEVLSLGKHEGGVTSEGAERMRQLMPRLWIDW